MVENSGIEPLTSCKAGALPAELIPHVVRWWVYQDLNLGPHPYQGCTLTS
jgi:hypothetical protein